VSEGFEITGLKASDARFGAMFAIFAALYAVATGTRRLFLSGVTPIADEQTPQSM
jgi:hypothetical protein